MSSHSAPCFYHHCADISIQGPLETPTPVPSTPTATPTQFAPATGTPVSTVCVGDCDNSGSVTISAIITLMNIALGTADPSRCPDGIPDGVQIDVALIIRAVNNALNSCHG